MSTLAPYLYKDEAKVVEELLGVLDWPKKIAASTEKRAGALVKSLRSSKRKMGELESFLQQYSLQTEEGVSLMCLAEALLRIPDKATANALIRDKVAAADWLQGIGESKDWMVKAAGVGLMMTSKSLDSVMSRMAQPVIREAMAKAMQMMGGQFVLGRDIHEAMKNAAPYQKKGYRMSYDMLGEGARTAEDAEHYFNAYAKAIG
ncbi:MAG TPA: bifunctional proline dehydrogenase/L-glutamate gamma-semialdehyde dehydrogenase, partial [Alphaproteobacteria bacterium]|nr:bifunctional proline dehydrogenase/L-glutamate gamma-semialdehyde dehydrogenase [Alphaproteobacteria bacterium]